MAEEKELVTLTIDGREIEVPKGTNLIEAAREAGVEIPHYCYHPHLSVAGNCRMCQVHVEGSRKMEIACNTFVRDGMEVKTQQSSPEVADAQRATLEFLLINHPLDCTVCDQAGHCKLQDYYYEYNGKPSRFEEKKVNQVKAEPVGPKVIYDGERCIVCTRCVRFCDEYTGTSELGVFNRGDKSVIGIYEGKELDNPYSGVVVDLCPVGALTHRDWRFNTRIWNTKESDTICTGCSTGCSAKVAVRDGQIVQVKGRLNSEVNQEWLCDEGRYGFDRFQPENRIIEPVVSGEEVSLNDALASAKELKSAGDAAVFISPLLTTEEVWLSLEFAQKILGLEKTSASIAIALRGRELSELESMLISPDYAPNVRSAHVLGMADASDSWRQDLEQRYDSLVKAVVAGKHSSAIFIGEGAISCPDADNSFRAAVQKMSASIAIAANADNSTGARVLLPGRSVHEKAGVMANTNCRIQRLAQLLQGPVGTYPDWLLLQRLAKAAGASLIPDTVSDERALFRQMVEQNEVFAGLSLMQIGEKGISIEELRELGSKSSSGEASVS